MRVEWYAPLDVPRTVAIKMKKLSEIENTNPLKDDDLKNEKKYPVQRQSHRKDRDAERSRWSTGKAVAFSQHTIQYAIEHHLPPMAIECQPKITNG